MNARNAEVSNVGAGEVRDRRNYHRCDVKVGGPVIPFPPWHAGQVYRISRADRFFLSALAGRDEGRDHM